MIQRTCNTCKHADVDSKDDPCFSCQGTRPHAYSRWEQGGTPRNAGPVQVQVKPVGQRPYYIKVDGGGDGRSYSVGGGGGAGALPAGGAGVSEPVCLSVIWDGPVFPRVGKQLEITAINRNFVTVKEVAPASMPVAPATLAEWQKKQLVEDVLKEWCGGTTKDNMLVLVDKVLEAIGRRDVANI